MTDGSRKKTFGFMTDPMGVAHDPGAGTLILAYLMITRLFRIK